MHRNITIGPDIRTSLADFCDFVSPKTQSPEITFSQELDKRMAAGPARLRRLREEGRAVYGITTGFGPLVEHGGRADSAHQEHLLEHLATGVGPDLPVEAVRATMLERLITLGKGHSLCRREVLDGLRAALSSGFVPAIPALGSVGASGDLTPLAHLARALLGSGEALHGERRVPAREELSRLELSPISLQDRDGLALVNGTSASTGLAILSWWSIASVFPVVIASQALMVRALGLPLEAYDARLHRARGQVGQIAVSDALRHALERTAGGGSPESPMLQAAYSFRCIAQILGPPLESLRAAAVSLERELNGVTDNPFFGDADDEVLHGGNFHGHVVAQLADSLSLAAANIAVLLDRQIARITDPLLNGALPAFLSPADIGPNSGLMGAQVTATALTEWLCSSASSRSMLFSRSTNAANQDVVSMSTGASWRLYESTARLRELVAIHLLTAVQAGEMSGVRDGTGLSELVRAASAPLDEDRSLAPDIRLLAGRLRPDAEIGREFRAEPAWELLFPSGEAH